MSDREQENADLLDVKELRKSARNQMCIDLEELLTLFLKRDVGLRILSQKMEISLKTLKRVLQKETDPQINTIECFYSYFFTIKDIDTGKDLFYKSVKNYLNSRKMVEEDQEENKARLQKFLRENKVFRKILLFATSGKITGKWVKEEFGRHGMSVLEMMIKENIILQLDKDIYTQGDLSCLASRSVVKSIMEDLIVDHYGVGTYPCEKVVMSDLLKDHKDELNVEMLSMDGVNCDGFFVIEGVNEEAQERLVEKVKQLRIDVSKEILNPESKGDRRVFVLGAVDMLKG